MHNIYTYLIAALIICHIPVIRKVFCTVNTMVHETGHAIAALLTSGKVYSVSLFMNSEGVAETGTRSWFSRFIVSYAGYTTSSVVAFLCFYFISIEQIQVIFYGLLLVAIINLLLWVRNFYGILWLSAFIGFSIYIEYKQVAALKDSFTLLLSCIILIHSVTSALAIFYLSIVNRFHAGDTTNLAAHTSIPALFWGLLFLVQSFVSVYYVFTLFIL